LISVQLTVTTADHSKLGFYNIIFFGKNNPLTLEADLTHRAHFRIKHAGMLAVEVCCPDDRKKIYFICHTPKENRILLSDMEAKLLLEECTDQHRPLAFPMKKHLS